MSATIERTVGAYAVAFERERLQQYPMVDAFERRMGYALDRDKLEKAARVLACPLKASPPNWQHGRVIYAATREYLKGTERNAHHALLDVGTAKGFSALCLYWALWDADRLGNVHSTDIIDPESMEKRNTVAEVEEPQNLYGVLEPWPERAQIEFYRSTGQKFLMDHPYRFHVAFIDGKHSYEVVSWEVALLAQRQESGDLAMFDDAHIAGVAKALKEQRAYELEYLEVLPNRKYAIGRRK